MILVALGANLASSHGSPLEALAAARDSLRKKGVVPVSSSRVWLTAPVPVSDDPWYHNAVIRVDTVMDPQALLSCLLETENEFGRVRTVRNAPRVLDLDLLAHGNLTRDEAGLTVPHPRMHERAFVLMPLRDAAPDWVHPVLGQTVDEMITALTVQDAKPLTESGEWR